MTPEAAAPSPEPDFVLGPLFLVAAAAFIRGARRREPASVAFGVAALAAELGWPAYRRFMRTRAVPNVLAHYPDN